MNSVKGGEKKCGRFWKEERNDWGSAAGGLKERERGGGVVRQR